MKLVSPEELHKAACAEYLNGRKPRTKTEWILCVNFWAFNAAKGTRVAATQLMAMIYSCPLPEKQIREIAEFHEKGKSNDKRVSKGS